jgi:predicted aspartyl protease
VGLPSHDVGSLLAEEQNMGETFAEINLIANGKQIKKKLLVDTGSTFSWISKKTLKQLGVQPVDDEELETIEGKIVKRKITQIEIEYLGRRAYSGIIFAKDTDSEVLGLHALESLRLEVDPFRHKLKKSRAIKAL